MNRTPLARRVRIQCCCRLLGSTPLNQAIGFVESNPCFLGHVIVCGRVVPFRDLDIWDLDVSKTAAAANRKQTAAEGILQKIAHPAH